MTEKIKLKIEGNSKSAEKALDKVDKKTRNLAKSFKGAAGAAAKFGAVVAAVGVGYALKTAAEFESLRVSLKTVTGSVFEAEKAFNVIKEFAATTPFQLTEVTDAFIKMKAFGLDASSEALRAYGNTASAMGKSLNQMIEAVADAATGEFERLKEFGIKSSSQGDKVTFTFKGISTTVKKSAKEITGYLKTIGNEDFAGAMSDQMDTLLGKYSNFSDSLATAADAFAGASGLTEAAKGFLSVITEGLTDLRLWMTTIDAFTDDELVGRFAEASLALTEAQDKFENTRNLRSKAKAEGAVSSAQLEFDNVVAEFQERYKTELEMADQALKDKAVEIAAKGPELGDGGADPVVIAQGEQYTVLTTMYDEYFGALTRKANEAKAVQQGNTKALFDFEVKTTGEKAKFLLQSAAATTAGLTGTSKKMFKINKALSLAQAAVALPAAVIDSFKNNGGYPWGIIPAALMAAAGARQIQAIKSSKFGGGGSTASVGTGGATFNPSLPTGPLPTGQGIDGTPAQPREAVILNIGTGRFTEEDGANMIELFKKLGGDGYDFEVQYQ